MRTPGSNPFSASRLSPGQTEFWFGNDDSRDTFLKRCAKNGWRGQIVGPHGSGKSTLMCALAAWLRGCDVAVDFRRYRVGPDHRIASFNIDGSDNFTGDPVLRPSSSLANLPISKSVRLIDGFEQISRFSRRVSRWRGDGLIVTSHQDMGLPTLIETRGTMDHLRWVVSQLLSDASFDELAGGRPIDDTDLERVFAETDGNIRESLFRLYDVWEVRKRNDKKD